jgi:hypothetical protein
MVMEDNPVPRQAIYQFERTYLEKLRLAADVILNAAPDGSLVSDPSKSNSECSRTALNSRCCFPPP